MYHYQTSYNWTQIVADSPWIRTTRLGARATTSDTTGRLVVLHRVDGGTDGAPVGPAIVETVSADESPVSVHTGARRGVRGAGLGGAGPRQKNHNTCQLLFASTHTDAVIDPTGSLRRRQR